jgi:hypothetical protein
MSYPSESVRLQVRQSCDLEPGPKEAVKVDLFHGCGRMAGRSRMARPNALQ